MQTQRSFYFFNDTATTEIYTLSLHDALPISPIVRADSAAWSRCSSSSSVRRPSPQWARRKSAARSRSASEARIHGRSEEHTSELQSRQYLVCRLPLDKKRSILNSIPLITFYA